MNASVSGLRTLVLNADFQPLSWAPLSAWSWQQALVAVMQERVIQVKSYDDVLIQTQRQAFEVPAVVVLKRYRKRKHVPFSRYNVFLRDEFRCQYCGERLPANELTFDHVVPKSRNGHSTWENIVSSCGPDNLRKANRTPGEARMKLLRSPFRPTPPELDRIARKMPLVKEELHNTWLDYLYWSAEIEG
ncbi:HNH endonuclease [Pseudorhodobacter aquimaris]|uniref:HNH endonuclease n=1 Tax=Pseudorhodobacter aquimaris TaxID=687412 RepID=UPI00067CAD36|nr:HNH endonuclease [Pseudorhodobacter aquimaris]